ncbi:hypothetical protein [Pseudofulvibacter geojedonensis]|uniref:Lipocalin-like domain-containing protein n=1 Tax=Pseudofulvibacter geojedonensis TaxID=1123758 RepID=A0ABW3I5V6_9FLAO
MRKIILFSFIVNLISCSNENKPSIQGVWRNFENENLHLIIDDNSVIHHEKSDTIIEYNYSLFKYNGNYAITRNILDGAHIDTIGCDVKNDTLIFTYYDVYTRTIPLPIKIDSVISKRLRFKKTAMN